MKNPFASQSAVSTGGPSDLMDDACDFCTLTKKQRLYGWLMCFVIGFILTILSTLCLLTLNITGFAIIYTLGNLISLGSTGFLIGPLRQLKTMFAKVRVFATIIYLVLLVATLVEAITLKNFVLTIILCILQFCALFWYCALIRKTLGGATSLG
ncbi:Got1/Sft2-like family-domain-containing protein [Thamnocephalis sphaerospora]|uniref:Protein transport protein SFT2 n=1 Tax=Thamnocephalis sphaerospora TaxID=78915 RepID=A0A4P9XWG0_9FUNG|nr:Got1/Sft2-like family-domain-containing protein [Thamnocephalis sphaerospora]|eukprot:RKP10657.1 Got1/Sft2-like family-domain-containing protein [Thamnocephalis sphaerospora]